MLIARNVDRKKITLTGVTTTLSSTLKMGESDGTAKNTETELSMIMFCNTAASLRKQAVLSLAPQYLNWKRSKLTIVMQAI